MRIHLIGEAAAHRGELESGLAARHGIVALPAEAAYTDAFDEEIQPEDVVVSLRFGRQEIAPAFRLLHVPGAGLDAIDTASLRPETQVCNVFEHEIPIAEYVMRCLLDWEIRSTSMQSQFSVENWPELYQNREPHGEVYGKTLGLIGFGHIGQAIARRAEPFGIEVLATSPRTSPAKSGVRYFTPDQLDIVLTSADYVVIACPLTPETEGLIAEQQFALMKTSAVLINTSRAAIVDESALYHALTGGTIAGAFLDVWYAYPTSSTIRVSPSKFPILELSNAYCTPHTSAWTRQLFRRRYAVIADNINRLDAGQPLRNVSHRSASCDHGKETHEHH